MPGRIGVLTFETANNTSRAPGNGSSSDGIMFNGHLSSGIAFGTSNLSRANLGRGVVARAGGFVPARAAPRIMRTRPDLDWDVFVKPLRRATAQADYRVGHCGPLRLSALPSLAFSRRKL